MKYIISVSIYIVLMLFFNFIYWVSGANLFERSPDVATWLFFSNLFSITIAALTSSYY